MNFHPKLWALLFAVHNRYISMNLQNSEASRAEDREVLLGEMRQAAGPDFPLIPRKIKV